jgi:hypothetical protein
LLGYAGVAGVHEKGLLAGEDEVKVEGTAVVFDGDFVDARKNFHKDLGRGTWEYESSYTGMRK